jgi:hypothetical protein
MVSPLSIIIYVVLGALLLGFYQHNIDILIALALTLLPLSLVFGHILSVSFHRACREVKVDCEKEFEQQKFFYYVSFTSFLFTGTFFFLLGFSSWDLFLDAIYTCTLGSATLVQLAPAITEITLGYFSYVLDVSRAVKGPFILLIASFLVVLCWSFFFLNYYIFPTRARKARIKALLTQIQVFLFTFIVVQIITSLSQPNLPLTTTSIFISLVTSSLSMFLKSSLTHILTRPT